MDNLFLLIFFASIISLVVGLVKPTVFSRFNKGEIKRKKIAVIFGSVGLIFLICFVVTNIYTRGKQPLTTDKTETISVDEARAYLAQANEAYDKGDRETAKELYLKAAKGGNAEAHFMLAYKYVLPSEEGTFHYIEAAKRGHEEALGYALEDLFFRAASLNKADPLLALETYEQAKKANSSSKLYDEETKVKTIKMCVEPGEFDSKTFIKEYNIIDEGENHFYSVWSLVEEASRGGRFGKPDPKLILNLVCRGGFVPAELEGAVSDVYNNWKEGVVKEFTICNYVTSGIGMGYCASRENDIDEETRMAKLKELGKSLDDNSKTILSDAYKSAEGFIELKAGTEEGHGGSGRVAWIIDSEIQQKNEYLQSIEKIQNGYVPKPKQAFLEADTQLNKTYQAVLKKLREVNNENDYIDYQPTPNDMHAVQRLWIAYRDNSAKLFSKLNASIDENIYKSWLTETRNEELMSILKL